MKKPAHKQQPKEIVLSGIVIKLEGKEFTYDHVKIVSQSAPMTEQKIDKIVFDRSVTASDEMPDADSVVRVVKSGQFIYLLSGRKLVEERQAEGKLMIHAKLVSLAQLMRCEVPAKKIDVSVALNLLASSDKFKVKPVKATSTSIASIGELGQNLNSAKSQAANEGVRQKTGFYQSRQNTAQATA